MSASNLSLSSVVKGSVVGAISGVVSAYVFEKRKKSSVGGTIIPDETFTVSRAKPFYHELNIVMPSNATKFAIENTNYPEINLRINSDNKYFLSSKGISYTSPIYLTINAQDSISKSIQIFTIQINIKEFVPTSACTIKYSYSASETANITIKHPDDIKYYKTSDKRISLKPDTTGKSIIIGGSTNWMETSNDALIDVFSDVGSVKKLYSIKVKFAPIKGSSFISFDNNGSEVSRKRTGVKTVILNNNGNEENGSDENGNTTHNHTNLAC